MSQSPFERDVDEALRRRLSPPPPEAWHRLTDRALQAPGAAPARLGARVVWRGGLGVAAALAVIVGAWLIWQAGVVGRAAPSRTPPRLTMAEVYRAEVAAGLVPKWRCDDEQEFADSIGGRFGQPLVLASLPADVEALGLCYANTLSPSTLHVLARRGGRPIVVFVDRIERDRPAALDTAGDGELNVFRATVGGLVLYEVSPLEAPVLLDHFKVAPDRNQGQRS